jgi:hypothetical protein
MELLFQVGHGATHAMSDRLAGVTHVVQARAIALLRHDLAHQVGQNPADRLAFLAAIPFDRDPVEHGKTGTVLKLRTHSRHDSGACRQIEVARSERRQRAAMPARGLGDLLELCGACLGDGHEPVAAPQLRPFPGKQVLPGSDGGWRPSDRLHLTSPQPVRLFAAERIRLSTAGRSDPHLRIRGRCHSERLRSRHMPLYPAAAAAAG